MVMFATTQAAATTIMLAPPHSWSATRNKLARVSLRFSTASEMELGTLKTYSELHYNWNGDGNGKANNYNGGLHQRPAALRIYPAWRSAHRSG